jgi:adenylate cyclase
MTNEQDIKKNPWQFINTFFNRKLTIIQIGANLTGSGIVTLYFMFFNKGHVDPNTKNTLIVIGIMFIGLVIIATVFLKRWLKDLILFVDQKMHGQSVDLDLQTKVQRKILNLPYICSLVSLFNWFLAANIMTIYFSIDLIAGSRTFIGVIIAGIVTCAIVFFTIEKSCSKIWPYFFPDGGLIKTPAVFRLRLHIRMLIIFGLASVMPIILMAVLSYNKAKMMLVLPPQDVIGSLLFLTAFLLVVSLATAIFLSRAFSNSIIAPIRRMENAMAKVEAGDFTALVSVDTNDELGALTEHFNQMTEGLRDRERMRETFGRFVTPEIAKAILENPPSLGGESAQVSILFSDVRNYTAICENLSPEKVIALLNDYFSYMVRAVEKHHGLVYQFVGDGIMAVFGAPAKLPEHAVFAVKCAMEMKSALKQFNDKRTFRGPPLQIGIGINSGPVVAGIIGTEERMEYRVVGDSVNLAARIEALNKEFRTDVLISHSTANQLPDTFKVKAFPPVRVKGKVQRVQVYQVIGHVD